MQVVQVRRNVLVEAVGEVWAAFSPASGGTLILNDEAAALLEVLSEAPRSLEDAAQVIALDCALSLHTALPLLEDAAINLEAAGLIESAESPGAGVRPAGDRAA